MSNSKINSEFQKRIKEGIDQEEYTKQVRKKILEHKYLGSNTRNKGEKEK